MNTRMNEVMKSGSERFEEKIWLTTYTDLMTNLMLFFLMLFMVYRISSNERNKVFRSMKRNITTFQEKRRFREILKIERKTRDKITETISGIFGENGMASVNISEKYISIKLPSPVLFDLGQAEFKKEGKDALILIAKILKPLPQRIVVEGHTDNSPVKGTRSPFLSNWELSAARALKIIDFLIAQRINPERLSAVGYGEYHPVCLNDTEENRAKNRRIEIKIVREG